MTKERSGELPETVSYSDYLQLNKLLDAQSPRCEAAGVRAHDEMLFIIVHQCYELWFKQILHEMTSVLDLFGSDRVDESQIGTVVHRLRRVIEIQQLLVSQIRIIETMTPLDFLDFRNLLSTASGFQSWQFRLLENRLGLGEKQRLRYSNRRYSSYFTEEIKQQLEQSEQQGTLFDGVSAWLERTPFLELGEFQFLRAYEEAAARMLEADRKTVRQSTLISSEERDVRLKMIDGTAENFHSVIDAGAHQKLVDAGERRLSHRATIAALFINLYRDEPILQMPFNLLQALVEIDESMSHWRSRHTQMVLRMLGRKIGTGGSSGHDYLRATIDQHRIFMDFFNLATCLIPRSELPVLPESVRRELRFHFSREQGTC